MAGTTTNYGWTYPTSTDLVKDGATAIQTATQGVDTTLFTALGGNYPGLRLIKKQTVGSAVASVTVTGAFSATYDNYKIVYSGGTKSADGSIRLSLGASASGYNTACVYATYGTGTALAQVQQSATYFDYIGSGDASASFSDFDLIRPFAAAFTGLSNATFLASGAAGTTNGQHRVATSYTDFTMTAGSGGGTLTGGTIYVYGYGIS